MSDTATRRSWPRDYGESTFADARDAKESASFLGVSPRRVRALWDEGRLPYVKRGGIRYTPIADLEDFKLHPRPAHRPPPPKLEDHYSTPEFAVFLGVSKGRARSIIAEERVPSILHGGVRYVHKDHAAAYKASPGQPGRPRNPILQGDEKAEARRTAARRSHARRRLRDLGIE